jgi:hypothetical protein
VVGRDAFSPSLEPPMSPIQEQMTVRMPRHLLAFVLVAAVIGTIAILREPQQSEAGWEATSSGGMTSGDFRLVCEVETGTHDCEVYAGPGNRNLYLVKDQSGRAVGVYETLREVTAKFPVFHAVEQEGAFAAVPRSWTLTP